MSLTKRTLPPDGGVFVRVGPHFVGASSLPLKSVANILQIAWLYNQISLGSAGTG